MNANADMRWKRDRRGSTIPHFQHFNGRRWNIPADFPRPSFEPPSPSTRKKYLQRSLTSSEILNPSYRCLPTVPNHKLHNNFCNSNKSVHIYEGCNYPPLCQQPVEGRCSKIITNDVSVFILFYVVQISEIVFI